LPILPSKSALFTSDPSGDWVRRYIGIEMLSIDERTMFASLDEAAATLVEHAGVFAYARIKRDSGVATLSAYHGDNFGMAFAQANSWVGKIFA
jgi:hypothetical protein